MKAQPRSFGHLSKKHRSFRQEFHQFAESERDIIAGMLHKDSRTHQYPVLDDFKLASGLILMAAGITTLNPLEIAGGTIPFVEAAHNLEQAGHRYRLTHRHRLH